MKEVANNARRAIYTHPELGTITGEVRLDKYDNVEYFYASEKHWPRLVRLGFEPLSGFDIDDDGISLEYA